jgi:hypothetical protein
MPTATNILEKWKKKPPRDTALYEWIAGGGYLGHLGGPNTGATEGTTCNVVNLFILSQNEDGSLAEANTALKRNLQNYLLDLKMLTDKIIIRDAFIINISVEFEITAIVNYNSQEVLLNVIDHLKEYFDISNWSIGQALPVSDIRRVIYDTDGVQSIDNLEVRNECDAAQGYNANFYDMAASMADQVYYPSVDPSIFEVKFPNKDIKGTVRN